MNTSKYVQYIYNDSNGELDLIPNFEFDLVAHKWNGQMSTDERKENATNVLHFIVKSHA